MSKVYYLLNTDNKLGYNGRVFGIPEKILSLLRNQLVDQNCNPEDYIFETNYREGAVPYNWAKQFMKIA